MGLYYFEDKEIYKYGVWKIEEVEKDLQDLSDCTAPSNITNTARRIEYLAVRSLVKIMGVNPKDILYMTSGKPYLMNAENNISISHTKGYVAVLLSSFNLSAIDIETRSERVLKIRKKFMALEEELELVASGSDEVTGLLLHWCAKEAMFKAVPYEGIDFISELHVKKFTFSGQTGSLEAISLRDDCNFVIDYLVDKDFVLTCCFSK